MAQLPTSSTSEFLLELVELGLASFQRLRFPKELSCPVHLRSALSGKGHHGHCFLVLGLQLVVRSLEDVHFFISLVQDLCHLGWVRS